MRWTLAILTVIALILAGALTYNLTQPSQPPLPSEEVESRRDPAAAQPPAERGADGPTGLVPSAQNELDCVDRLLERGAAEGADLKAEWDRCAALGEAGQNRMGAADRNPERERTGSAQPRP